VFGHSVEELRATRVRAPRESPAATRVRRRMTPRRNVNPAEGRRYRALLALVLLILLGLMAGAIVTANGQVKAPDMHGLSRARVIAKLRALSLRAAFSNRYDQAPPGTAIAQRPAVGTRVDGGSTVRVTLSAGPRPVVVPQLVGQTSAAAAAILQGLGLVAGDTPVPAPGASPGLVVGQSPGPQAKLPPHSTVALSVAETPRWRPLTSFAGIGSGVSVPFKIRGKRWQVVSSMAYDGGCSLLFFCSGPSAQVTHVDSGANVDQFDLGEGSGRTRVFESGPGVYQIRVTPGSDTAHWSVAVDDYY
jgi:PASTA domain